MSCNGVYSSRLDKLNRVDDPPPLPTWKKNKEYNNRRKKKGIYKVKLFNN